MAGMDATKIEQQIAFITPQQQTIHTIDLLELRLA